MTSVFDELFRESVLTTMMEYHGDEATVSYEVNGTPITGIIALIGHREIVEVEDSVGTIRKAWRMPLHFTKEEASKWKGIPDPQFKGFFTIDGDRWKLEDRDSIPIEGISRSMITVLVTRKMAVNKGQRNLREHS